MKFCPRCGKSVEKDHVFCSQCGYRISEATAEMMRDAEAEAKLRAVAKAYTVTVIMFSLVALALAGSVVWLAFPVIRGDDKVPVQTGDTVKGEVKDDDFDKDKGTSRSQTGFIEGRLGFSAGDFQEEMMVCAYNQDTG
jgi:uncharacterized membrane protein YvbJ